MLIRAATSDPATSIGHLSGEPHARAIHPVFEHAVWLGESYFLRHVGLKAHTPSAVLRAVRPGPPDRPFEWGLFSWKCSISSTPPLLGSGVSIRTCQFDRFCL